MSKIRILPENLANQIAAGEVVERPASVVKEFVENALDAGASQISVQIEGDGSRLIRVVDDGEGMEEDDVLLSLERHATSKLRSAQDLVAIGTLGFRGEAIPSIASVARLTIVSRTRKVALGCKAEVRFGKIIKVHDMGCAPGTVMEVKDLFANMPARRKFLKSKKTELSHIDDVIKNYALVNPDVGFLYQVQGRTILDLPAESDSFADRVRTIVCRGIDEPLLEMVEGGTDDCDISVSGYLAAPGVMTGSGRLRLFVNGRVVKDKDITHAVAEGLQGFLLKGRSAAGAVFLSMPAHLVDVNVHPTKQEVRFQKLSRVHDVIVQTIRAAMASYQKIRRNEVFGVPESVERPEKEAESPIEAVSPGRVKELPVTVADSFAEGQPLSFDRQSVIVPNRRSYEEFSPVDLMTRETVLPVDDHLPESESIDSDAVHAKIADTDTEMTGGPETFRYVGQIFNSYILCETGEGFLVVDQHAAQERLLFETFRRQYSKKAIPQQILLFPEVVELAVAQGQIIEQYDSEISRLGLDVKEFGGESYIITAVPAALGHLGPSEVLRGVLSQFMKENGIGGRATRLESVLAEMACKASIRAGHRLLPKEADALLAQMQQAGVFSHCPHGRPVAKVFSKADLKKWFLRT